MTTIVQRGTEHTLRPQQAALDAMGRQMLQIAKTSAVTTPSSPRDQREEKVLALLKIGMQPRIVAKVTGMVRNHVLRLKRKFVKSLHEDERYSPSLIARIVRMHSKDANVKEIAYAVEIPTYQVRRIFREYRLRAPGRGARYDVTKETEQMLRRRDRKWCKALASRFHLPLRSIQKILKRRGK